MPTQKNYDWDAIRLEYMAGYQTTDPLTGIKRHKYPTHKDLVEKYGMSLEYLKQKSGKEKWSQSRTHFQSKFREKATADQIQSFLSDSAQFDAMTVDKLKRLYRLVDAYLNQYSSIIDDPDGLEPDLDNLPEGVTLKVRDLLDLTTVLDRCQALIRRTLGEPIVNDTHFKELLTDIASVSKNIAGNEADVDSQIDKLIERKQSYSKAARSIEEEISRLKEEITV